MSQNLLVSCLLFSVIQLANAQGSCLPNSISFYTQVEIDALPRMCRSCTVIEGYVNIDTLDDSTVASLIKVTLIQGDLTMSEKNITDLNGFAKLITT